MGTSTLTNRSSGQTIQETFFNDIHSALSGDLVGRNSSGVATLGQSLGTNALPFGSGYITNLILNGSAVDTSLLTAPKNRIVSGKTRAASNQPQFIDPNGAAASFVLEATATDLVLDIDGTAVTFSSDVTKSSLTVGPSTTATALINDVNAADDEYTRTSGEYGAQEETLNVDAMGAEFQAFIGQWVIVQIAGVGTEYALVFVKSATELTNIYRGFLYDSASTPINRTAFTNNDVITVLSTGWVFVEDDGATVDVSYTNPIRSFTAPSGPATGDYWYDLANETWKRYDGASWQIISRTLVGVVGIDSTNCVCARSFDFYQKYADTNNINLEINSTEIVQIKNQDALVNVYGNAITFGFNHESWNITTDLAGASDMYNATEQASTYYYAYVKDTGETAVSDISPYYRPDLLGWYQPHNPWRCVGRFFNDSSLDIESARSAFANKYWYTNSSVISFDATTTAPTKGSASIDEIRWDIEENYMNISLAYRQAAGAAGSGTYLIDIPNGRSINPNEAQYGAAAVASDNTLLGQGLLIGSAAIMSVFVYAHSATELYLLIGNAQTGAGGGSGWAMDLWGSANNSFVNADLQLTLTVRIPILG